MKEINKDSLPEVGVLINLYFYDGGLPVICTREYGKVLDDQWHFETPTGFISSCHPLIAGWEYFEE